MPTNTKRIDTFNCKREKKDTRKYFNKFLSYLAVIFDLFLVCLTTQNLSQRDKICLIGLILSQRSIVHYDLNSQMAPQ